MIYIQVVAGIISAEVLLRVGAYLVRRMKKGKPAEKPAPKEEDKFIEGYESIMNYDGNTAKAAVRDET